MIDFGHGVYLDNIHPNFLDQLRQWRNDPHVWKWCRQNDLISMWDQRVWAENLTSSPKSKMYQIVATIEPPRVLVAGKEPPKNAAPELRTVGVCGFSEIDRQHLRAEFSIYIATEYQRKGYGKRGAQTLFDHGFTNMGLNVIYGDVFEKNPAINIFVDLGFKPDGVRRQFYWKGGKFIDATIISATREDWCIRYPQKS